MVSYLIVCRSLTYAQRTHSALSQVGITAHIMRSPKIIDSEGCSHSVRVGERDLDRALAVLDRTGLFSRRVFVIDQDGSYQEVRL